MFARSGAVDERAGGCDPARAELREGLQPRQTSAVGKRHALDREEKRRGHAGNDGDDVGDQIGRAELGESETGQESAKGEDGDAEPIRREFGVAPTAYYQLLSRLLDDPAAMAYDPMLVKRLQRQRASRRRQRSTGRLSSQASGGS